MNGISIIYATHNMGVDILFVQLSSLLTEIWPKNDPYVPTKLFGEFLFSPIHKHVYTSQNLSVLRLRLRINDFGLFAWIRLILLLWTGKFGDLALCSK